MIYLQKIKINSCEIYFIFVNHFKPKNMGSIYDKADNEAIIARINSLHLK